VKPLLWYPANVVFRGLEQAYRRFHRLIPVGPLLYIQPRAHRGPAVTLGDTVLQPGDPVGVIHFNNEALERAQTARNARHGGFVFARLLFEALHALAERVQQDPELGRVAGFHGITWIPPHGQRVGFHAEPLPESWRTRWLSFYFRALLYAFNPQTAAAMSGELKPYQWWMSREQLLANFGDGRTPRKR
jgi:hypothetical protein